MSNESGTKKFDVSKIHPDGINKDYPHIEDFVITRGDCILLCSVFEDNPELEIEFSKLRLTI